MTKTSPEEGNNYVGRERMAKLVLAFVIDFMTWFEHERISRWTSFQTENLFSEHPSRKSESTVKKVSQLNGV